MKHLSYKQADFGSRIRSLNDAAEAPLEVVQQVPRILEQVRTGGDMALLEINNRFSPVPIERS